MFKYDSKRDVLVIQKVENPQVDFDLLRDQRESYREYVTKTIYKDMQCLLEELRVRKGQPNLQMEVRVCPLYKSSYRKDIKKQSDCYYPVEATFYNGIYKTEPLLVFRIPYLDDFCKLNVGGRRKVLVNEQRSAEDISYDEKRKCINITLPSANINISATTTGVKLKYGNKKLNFDLVIRAALFNSGITLHDYSGKILTLPEYISSDYLLSTIETNPYFIDKLNADNIDKVEILKRYESDQYTLGETRDALNTFLTIDSAIMEELSRPVAGYEEGTIITTEILQDLKRKRVNEVYVKHLPHIDGMYLATDRVFVYDFIPRGTRNCEYLAKRFPDYAKQSYLHDDIVLDMDNLVFIDSKEKLTRDEVEFLSIMGEKEIRCVSTKGGQVHTYRFEREIVGNYTARLGDLTDDIPDDRRADEWVYYYNNPSLSSTDQTHLNAHDLVALLSLIGRIYTTGDNPLLNRDTSYLKKVNLINEAFSENFREVVPEFVRKYSRMLDQMMRNSHTRNPFGFFTKMWSQKLQNKRLLAEADTINVAAEITQVSHISTILQSASSANDEIRQIAIPYYGRLCPYETPAGKKLGLVNTKAIGAHVIDNKLVAPYRRVKKTSNGITLSNKIEYLTSKESMLYKIGDVLSLRTDDNGNYVNTVVRAFIPNPDPSGERVIFGQINSFELDYVNAHTEQHLSPTAALMPCASSNDAVRVSYGLNMIRQAIYIQKSEVPDVRTFMYDDIFKYSNSFLIRAKKPGTVISVDVNSLVVTYDDGEEEEFEVPETRVTNDSITFLNYKVREMEHFNEGDILIDSCVSKDGCFTPARNALVAYISTGWNYEDAVEVSEYATTKYVSISNNTITKKLQRSSKSSVSIGSSNRFKYVANGEAITSLSIYDNNDTTRKRKEYIRAVGTSGLFYDTERVIADNGDVAYKCYMLGFNTLQRGDKMSGRHGNKGVVSRVTPNSEMPILRNGEILDVILNPCGVPSRMNVGQILDTHLGLAAHVLGIKTQSDPFNGASRKEVKLLMSYAYDMANSDNPEAVSNTYTMIPIEIRNKVLSHIEDVQHWRGVFDRNGNAILWDPVTGTDFEFPITIGYQYYMKLVHEATHKSHVRAGMYEELYSQVSGQPTKGARRGGGQAMGEMELCAIAAHGANAYLKEILNEKSDNCGERANIHLKALKREERVDADSCVPRSVEALVYLLEALGIHTEMNSAELPDFDLSTSMGKYTYDIRAILRNRLGDEVMEESSSDILNRLRKGRSE